MSPQIWKMEQGKRVCVAEGSKKKKKNIKNEVGLKFVV
jgi:hypothetical protein